MSREATLRAVTGTESTPEVPKPVPALGFSFQVALAEGTGLVFQSHMDSQAALASPATLDDLLDTAARAALRQKARFDIQKLELELKRWRAEMATREHDRTNAVDTHALKLIDLDRQTKDLADSQRRRILEFEKQHVARGRQGAYKPSGTEKQQIDAMEHGLLKIDEERQRAEAEHKVTLGNMDVTLKRIGEQIDSAQGQIAALKAEFGI